MKALYNHGFPVPRPYDVNRHCVVMALGNGYQLNSIQELKHPGVVFDALMEQICRLASFGLIHCDFNEFNLLVSAGLISISAHLITELISSSCCYCYRRRRRHHHRHYHHCNSSSRTLEDTVIEWAIPPTLHPAVTPLGGT